MGKTRIREIEDIVQHVLAHHGYLRIGGEMEIARRRRQGIESVTATTRVAKGDERIVAEITIRGDNYHVTETRTQGAMVERAYDLTGHSSGRISDIVGAAAAKGDTRTEGGRPGRPSGSHPPGA